MRVVWSIYNIHSILYHVFIGSIIYFPLTCSLRKAKFANIIIIWSRRYNKDRQESRISPKGKSQQCGSGVEVVGAHYQEIPNRRVNSDDDNHQESSIWISLSKRVNSTNESMWLQTPSQLRTHVVVTLAFFYFIQYGHRWLLMCEMWHFIFNLHPAVFV